MKLLQTLGVIAAVMLHVGFILFGGVFFPHQEKHIKATTHEVELAQLDQEEKKTDPKDAKATDDPEEQAADQDAPPDASAVMQSLDTPLAPAGPALDSAGLDALTAALTGSGGGDFAQAVSFSTGGTLGATGGKVATLAEKTEQAFSLAEIDQKPRAVFQSTPDYPSEMRGKQVEGRVTVFFVVDASGKVSSARAEKASHDPFRQPALDAVKQWKFEPAVKAGQRVSCKMRVTIRFERS